MSVGKERLNIADSEVTFHALNNKYGDRGKTFRTKEEAESEVQKFPGSMLSTVMGEEAIDKTRIRKVQCYLVTKPKEYWKFDRF